MKELDEKKSRIDGLLLRMRKLQVRRAPPSPRGRRARVRACGGVV